MYNRIASLKDVIAKKTLSETEILDIINLHKTKANLSDEEHQMLVDLCTLSFHPEPEVEPLPNEVEG